MAKKTEAKRSSCFFWLGWLTLSVLVMVFLVFLVLVGIFDLGVWDEFWELFSLVGSSPNGKFPGS